MRANVVLAVLIALAIPTRVAAHACDDVDRWALTVKVLATNGTAEWCAPATDAKGLTITAWDLFIDGAVGRLKAVTRVSATANGAGLVLWSAPIKFVRGTHAYEIAGVSAAGIAAKTLTLSVQCASCTSFSGASKWQKFLKWFAGWTGLVG